MYSVFSGSILRHSSGFDAAITSGIVGVLPGGGGGMALVIDGDWHAASASKPKAKLARIDLSTYPDRSLQWIARKLNAKAPPPEERRLPTVRNS